MFHGVRNFFIFLGDSPTVSLDDDDDDDEQTEDAATRYPRLKPCALADIGCRFQTPACLCSYAKMHRWVQHIQHTDGFEMGGVHGTLGVGQLLAVGPEHRYLGIGNTLLQVTMR